MIREISTEIPDVSYSKGRLLYTTTNLTRDQRLHRFEVMEEEISRLTWAVVDGRASREQRRELAELIEEQHATRYADLGS